MTPLAGKLRITTEPEFFGSSRQTPYMAAQVTESAIAEWSKGRIGGSPVASWVDQAAFHGEIHVYSAGPASIWPLFGVVANRDSHLFRASIGEALTSGYTAESFESDAVDEEIGPAAAYLPFGAQFNYGHFLLDGMASLEAMHSAGMMDGRVAVSDPLDGWQRELMDLAFPETPRHETAARRVWSSDAIFADSMDHYLHRPSPVVNDLRDRILAQLGPATPGPERVYVSRRGSNMRLLVNEEALETAMQRRGFAVIHPETMPVRDQIALFRAARVVVAATGAGLTNVLFSRAGTKVVEILPSNFSASWVRDLCLRSGGEWYGWFTPSPLPPWRAWRYRKRPGLRFAWSLPLGPFLRWVDMRLR